MSCWKIQISTLCLMSAQILFLSSHLAACRADTITEQNSQWGSFLYAASFHYIVLQNCLHQDLLLSFTGEKERNVHNGLLSKAHSALSYNNRLEIYIIKSRFDEMRPSQQFFPLLSVHEDEFNQIKAITTKRVWQRWIGRLNKEEGCILCGCCIPSHHQQP